MPAARTVLRRVDGETVEVPRVEPSTRLVVRDGTAPVLRAADRIPS